MWWSNIAPPRTTSPAIRQNVTVVECGRPCSNSDASNRTAFMSPLAAVGGTVKRKRQILSIPPPVGKRGGEKRHLLAGWSKTNGKLE